jgi:hypothetical protein
MEEMSFENTACTKSRYQILGILAIGCQSMAMPQPRNVGRWNAYGGILLVFFFFFFFLMMMMMMMMIHQGRQPLVVIASQRFYGRSFLKGNSLGMQVFQERNMIFGQGYQIHGK